MTLNRQVTFAESHKGSFYNQKGWLEVYEYRKSTFYAEFGDDKKLYL